MSNIVKGSNGNSKKLSINKNRTKSQKDIDIFRKIVIFKSHRFKNSLHEDLFKKIEKEIKMEEEEMKNNQNQSPQSSSPNRNYFPFLKKFNDKYKYPKLSKFILNLEKGKSMKWKKLNKTSKFIKEEDLIKWCKKQFGINQDSLMEDTQTKFLISLLNDYLMINLNLDREKRMYKLVDKDERNKYLEKNNRIYFTYRRYIHFFFFKNSSTEKFFWKSFSKKKKQIEFFLFKANKTTHK